MSRVLIRVIGAPLLLAGVALCAYADYKRGTTTAVTVLIACFAAISFHELCAMSRLRGARPAEFLGLAALLINFGVVLRLLDPRVTISVVTLVLLLVLLARLVYRNRSFSPPDAAFTLMAFGYISLLLFVPAAASGGAWLYWLLFLVATNKGSDMAAYVVGKAIGRHKLAPTVSPNKTWEGAIAGLVAGMLLGVWVLGLADKSGEWAGRWGAAALVTVAAQMGDLVKSAIKRWAGVKDSGRLLPEFGGALDMVDSFILSAPLAFEFWT